MDDDESDDFEMTTAALQQNTASESGFHMNLRHVDIAKKLKPQKLVRWTGDPGRQYGKDECVWVLQTPYGWWPARVIGDAKETPGEVIVKWLGLKYSSLPALSVPKKDIIPWNPDWRDSFAIEIHDEDEYDWNDAVDQCNERYLNFCLLREQPVLKSAQVYENKCRKRAGLDVKPIEVTETAPITTTEPPLKRQKLETNVNETTVLLLSLLPVCYTLIGMNN